MRRAPPPSALRHFRLRGELRGVPCSFSLRPGENSIGSRSDNLVVLTDPSVSRRHAVLAVGEDGLRLEDLDSHNGTFVNDQRVKSRELSAGDTVRLGLVTLTLEPVAPADAELAIAVETPPTVGWIAAEAGSTRTGLARQQIIGGALLAVLEKVAEAMASEPNAAAPVLGVLSRELALAGCCVLDLGGAQPAVVSAVGETHAMLQEPAVREMLRRLSRKGGGAHALSTSRAGGRTVVGATVAGPEGRPLTLLAEGDRLGSEHVGLLRIVVRLLGTSRWTPSSRESAPRQETVGLVFPVGHVIGRSPAMATLYREMRPLSQGDLPVLVVGETGVGKEHIVRILHLSSPRRSGPFIAINCAALPTELLEAELFGIGKGVATGVEEREGRFQQAQGGVLLLDEVASMAPNLQAKLLRALQEHEVHPVGGKRTVAVDARVIAATNGDPLRLVRENQFRADLYYRIAGLVLRIPPLRERPEDIAALVEKFVQVFAAETGKTVRGVTVAALAALERYSWPGNVRELEHEVRRMVYLCPHGQAIDSGLIPPHLLGLTAPAGDEPLILAPRLAELETELIRQALARSGGNRSEAARLLGISRNGLTIKMERLGIETPEASGES